MNDHDEDPINQEHCLKACDTAYKQAPYIAEKLLPLYHSLGWTYSNDRLEPTKRTQEHLTKLIRDVINITRELIPTVTYPWEVQVSCGGIHVMMENEYFLSVCFVKAYDYEAYPT